MSTRMPPATRAPAVVLVLGVALVAFQFPIALAHDAPTSDHAGTVRLSGVLTDAETGDPIAGAAYWGYSYGEGGEAKDGGTTGEDGSYVLYLLDGRGEISFEAKGYERMSTGLTIDGDATRDVALNRTAPADAVVRGRVLGPDGSPVVGAVVTLTTGYYYIAEDSSGGSGGGTDGSPGSTEPAPPQSDEPNGTAASPPVESRIRAPDQYEWQQTRTDEEGRYSFEAHAGPKRLGYEAKGYAVVWKDHQVRSGENDLGDLRLEKAPERSAVLRGQVLDRETGRPVAGASVSVSNQEWGRYDWAQTDQDGRFEIRTYPGYTRVDVSAQYWGEPVPLPMPVDVVGEAQPEPAVDMARPAPGSGPAYYSYATTLTLAAGENDLRVQLKPKPAPTLVVTGYVVDATTDKAIPGAWVNIRNEDTGEYGYAQTDRDGSYKFLVRPGYLVVEAGASGYFGNVEMLEGGAVPVRLDVLLVPGETKYVPCEDCDHYAYPMTGRGDVAESGGKGAPPPAPGAAGMDAAAARESDGRAAGDATYFGGGGGLGPYQPGSRHTAGAPGGEKAVPALGLAGALAALGASALVVAARRRP